MKEDFLYISVVVDLACVVRTRIWGWHARAKETTAIEDKCSKPLTARITSAGNHIPLGIGTESSIHSVRAESVWRARISTACARSSTHEAEFVTTFCHAIAPIKAITSAHESRCRLACGTDQEGITCCLILWTTARISWPWRHVRRIHRAHNRKTHPFVSGVLGSLIPPPTHTRTSLAPTCENSLLVPTIAARLKRAFGRFWVASVRAPTS
jgi:hypothetical protein